MTHATAPRSARTLAQARPTMSCIHLVSGSVNVRPFVKSTGQIDFNGSIFVKSTRQIDFNGSIYLCIINQADRLEWIYLSLVLVP